MHAPSLIPCHENENFTRSVLVQNGVHTDTGLYSATILLTYAPKNRYVRTGKMIYEHNVRVTTTYHNPPTPPAAVHLH